MRRNRVARRVAGLEHGIDLAERQFPIGRERLRQVSPLRHIRIRLHADPLAEQPSSAQRHQGRLGAAPEETALERQTHVARPIEIVENERVVHQLVVRRQVRRGALPLLQRVEDGAGRKDA